jgi:hypothetical protein
VDWRGVELEEGEYVGIYQEICREAVNKWGDGNERKTTVGKRKEKAASPLLRSW